MLNCTAGLFWGRYPNHSGPGNLFRRVHLTKGEKKEIGPKNEVALAIVFVISKLDYCNSLLYGLPSYLIRKLQHVQNSAARLDNQCPRFCRITPVLWDLHWLPVSFCIEIKIMLITYKVLHDRAPIYIQKLLQLYTPSRNLRSSNRNLLVKPYFNLNSYGKRAFSVAAPELWNNLPEDIKSANSIDDFKRKLKTFLFMRAYES